MGADQSKKCPEPRLADKRYKVDPERRRRKEQTDKSSCPCPAISLNNNILTARSVESLPARTPPPEQPESEESSLVSPVSAPVKDTKHFLTKRDRILLEHSWKKTRKTGAEHVGSKIFFMVLCAQPDIKAIFGLEKIPQGRLKYDPRFRQHATVFTRTFDYVIKNLEYPGKLETHFESLGRRHVVMQGRGFDPLYWETFAECMTQAAVEWESNRQRPTLGAWRTLVSTIIQFMRRGFDEENTKRKVSSMIIKTPKRSITPTPAEHGYSTARF